MVEINKTAPVMVTGATGYVALWIVKQLLDEGHTVHATVRNPDNVEKLNYLNELARKSSGQIKYFRADLLEPGSYRDAVQGCELVFHTASPFVTSVKDPQKQLIQPAQMGTRNVLEEANRTDTVKRVVLTSSCAAIYGDNIDHEKTASGVFTEEDWNTSSTHSHQPYSRSKTVAEQEAWSIAGSQDRWDLVVVNPSLVIGPGINPHGTSESFALVRQIGDGTMKFGAPRLAIGVVDVRDVANAHRSAAFTPAAHGRYIISAYDTDFLAMAQPLIQRYGNAYPFPRGAIPNLLLWLVGPMVNRTLTRRFITANIGHPFRTDNRKAIRELDQTYRPMDGSIVEMFQQMIESGSLRRR
jgi:nucleoside-diphosphate-sugar epimerase